MRLDQITRQDGYDFSEPMMVDSSTKLVFLGAIEDGWLDAVKNVRPYSSPVRPVTATAVHRTGAQEERQPWQSATPERSWGACFLGAVRRAAAERKVRLTSTSIAVEATLTHGDDGEFGLSAVLNLELGGVDQETAVELGAAAHRICPYSKATRGNIPVTIHATAVTG
ncbi:OsmC family protein [Kitasatospora sp. NPDC017646]|uniref:OsmC family protein n=1 Tax=Kitasatospora sp. NPDC017646 TaxID=3364024 RepID=UPI003797308D